MLKHYLRYYSICSALPGTPGRGGGGLSHVNNSVSVFTSVFTTALYAASLHAFVAATFFSSVLARFQEAAARPQNPVYTL